MKLKSLRAVAHVAARQMDRSRRLHHSRKTRRRTFHPIKAIR
jgi:hypothetical protein